MVIANFLSNYFGATLSSKATFLSVWKDHFPVFCNVLSDEVETIFWEGKAKRFKLLKSKFDKKKLLRKWFWSYLELKKECCEHLKRYFFNFFPKFWVTKLKLFFWKLRQSVQSYLNKNLGIISFLENGFEATLSSNTNIVSV